MPPATRPAKAYGYLLRVLLTTVAVLLAAQGHEARAQVVPDPDYWKQTAEHRDTVYRFFYRQSPQAVPTAYDPVAEAERVLRERQATLPSSNPQAPNLWQQIRTITVKEALSTPLRALGGVAAGAGALAIGWKMGSTLRPLDPGTASATADNGRARDRYPTRPTGERAAAPVAQLHARLAGRARPSRGWRLSNPDFDPAFEEGAVVRVSPPPGTSVQPTDEVVVTVNRTKQRANNGECNRGQLQDPGPPPSGDVFSLKDSFSGHDPSEGMASASVAFRWGTTGWGYRHVELEHGWDNSQDRADTQAALLDPAPQPDDPGSYQFYFFYVGPNRTPCTHRVVARFDIFPLEDVKRGIITSFAHPGWYRRSDF